MSEPVSVTEIAEECPFCGSAKLEITYLSTGTDIYCAHGCHGYFTFPAFPEEVLTMWRDTLTRALADKDKEAETRFLTEIEHHLEPTSLQGHYYRNLAETAGKEIAELKEALRKIRFICHGWPLSTRAVTTEEKK